MPMETVAQLHSQIGLYDPQVNDRLTYFHDARNGVAAAKSSLRNLGDVICRHQIHEFVGVCLLHKHFDLKYSERLVRIVDMNQATSTPREAGFEHCVPFSWKLDPSSDRSVDTFRPLEFFVAAESSGAARRVAELSSTLVGMHEFWYDIAAVFRQLELQDVLGLSILNQQFLEKQPDEAFLETTNDRNRVLTLRPAPKSAVERPSIIETQWLFSPGETADGACTHCSHMGCNGHCFHS